MGKIKLAIAGVGNCASSLAQGIEYYKHVDAKDCIGLMHYEINGYRPGDIEVVAAFDVDRRKVGKDLSEAVFAEPNCTSVFYRVPYYGVEVKMGPVLDGVAPHMHKYPENKGCKFDRTYQLNTGGNTDFLNMLNRERLRSKKISKTETVQSVLDEPLMPDDIHIGPSDYVPWQRDNKVCFLRMEGRIFGDIPIDLELRLSVEDSPNSGGSTIDAIRVCKLALDREIAGPLIEISA